MEIEFAGAAREVTGSCHIVRVNGKTLALDFGLFQGRRAESEAKNRRLPFDVGALDAVVLSHAHIDHSGSLPVLFKLGYRGAIYTTEATRDLPGERSLANSAATLRFAGVQPAVRGDWVRPGIVLYGGVPDFPGTPVWVSIITRP